MLSIKVKKEMNLECKPKTNFPLYGYNECVRLILIK